MMYNVAVAHYGHPSLKIKHWAIIVLFSGTKGLAYQITGSTTTYELKEIESIDLLASTSYLGKVTVGIVHKDHLVQFGQIIAGGCIVHGNVDWKCQHWVVERLHDLHRANFNIRDIDHAVLFGELANAPRV